MKDKISPIEKAKLSLKIPIYLARALAIEGLNKLRREK
jgi:hypothetical protein